MGTYIDVKEANRKLVTNTAYAIKSKLEKYTPIPERGFPTIHLASPGQLVEDLNKAARDDWVKIKTPKLVARVFDYDGGDPTRMNPILTSRIKTIIDDVAGAVEAKNSNCIVSPPSPENGYPINSCPNVFLVHSISEETREAILSQKIWSSSHLTFEARPLVERSLPTLLLNLVGFTTDCAEIIREIAVDTWKDVEVKHQIRCILKEYDPSFQDGKDPESRELQLEAFIDSVEVELLNYKAAGGVATPRFNILADSPTASAQAWTMVKYLVNSFNYTSSLVGVGKPSKLYRCSLCHSASHPRGLCDFPNVPLWNGPQIDQKPKNKGRNNTAKNQRM